MAGDNVAVTAAPRRYGAVNVVGLRTLTQREIMRFLKVSAQTVVAPLVSTVLFMVVFAIAMQGVTSPFAGVRFPDFLAPGLIMMAIVNNAFANSSSSLIIAKVQGNSVDFLMPPLSSAELATAFIVGAAVRGLMVGLVGAIAVAPFAHVLPAHLWAVVFYATAASVMFGALGLLGGIWADKFDNIAAVTNFVVTPLTFLSGTFYSVDRLPQPFADIAHWNPVFFLIDGFRYGFVGQHDGPLGIGAAVVAALAAVLVYASYYVLEKGYKLRA